MNSQELKAYKRDKSKKFNAHLRDLRLKEKKRIADQEPDNQGTAQSTAQDNTIDKQDELSLQDLMDIYETLDTKMDIIQNKLENIMENKLDTKLETNTLLPQFKPILFA